MGDNNHHDDDEHYDASSESEEDGSDRDNESDGGDSSSDNNDDHDDNDNDVLSDASSGYDPIYCTVEKIVGRRTKKGKRQYKIDGRATPRMPTSGSARATLATVSAMLPRSY